MNFIPDGCEMVHKHRPRLKLSWNVLSGEHSFRFCSDRLRGVFGHVQASLRALQERCVSRRVRHHAGVASPHVRHAFCADFQNPRAAQEGSAAPRPSSSCCCVRTDAQEWLFEKYLCSNFLLLRDLLGFCVCTKTLIFE